jgi:hypothetical protein
MTEEEKLNRAANILYLIERARVERRTIASNIWMLNGNEPKLHTKYVHDLEINTAAFKRLRTAYKNQMKEIRAAIL